MWIHERFARNLFRAITDVNNDWKLFTGKQTRVEISSCLSLKVQFISHHLECTKH